MPSTHQPRPKPRFDPPAPATLAPDQAAPTLAVRVEADRDRMYPDEPTLPLSPPLVSQMPPEPPKAAKPVKAKPAKPKKLQRPAAAKRSRGKA